MTKKEVLKSVHWVIFIVACLAYLVWTSPLAQGQAQKFNLNTNEVQVLTDWLYEPSGYLDFTIRISDGRTARQELAENPTVDITAWVMSSGGPTAFTQISDARECAMIWWIVKNDNVNKPTAPAEEVPFWKTTLQAWYDSIADGLSRSPETTRNQSCQDITDSTLAIVRCMPSGLQLITQQSMILKVSPIL
jgi:hypothetical protein